MLQGYSYHDIASIKLMLIHTSSPLEFLPCRGFYVTFPNTPPHPKPTDFHQLHMKIELKTCDNYTVIKVEPLILQDFASSSKVDGPSEGRSYLKNFSLI